LIVDSYAARIQAMQAPTLDDYQKLMRGMLEEQDVRAATLREGDAAIHAGPRMRPLDADALEFTTLAPGTDVIPTEGNWRWRQQLAPGRVLEVEFASSRQRIEMLQTMLTLVLATVGIIGLALIPALRFSQRMTAPVQRFTETLEQIRDGELG